jgi:hypothetical protein
MEPREQTDADNMDRHNKAALSMIQKSMVVEKAGNQSM